MTSTTLLATPFKSITPGVRLSVQVADALSAEIRAARMVEGDRLPTEAALVGQFSVSRTVVREAVSRLKSLGLVESRQGSGVFVKRAAFSPLNFDACSAVSKQAVVQMVEVRRGLETEVAALAAERHTKADIQHIRGAAVRDGVAPEGVPFTLSFGLVVPGVCVALLATGLPELLLASAPARAAVVPGTVVASFGLVEPGGLPVLFCAGVWA